MSLVVSNHNVTADDVGIPLRRMPIKEQPEAFHDVCPRFVIGDHALQLIGMVDETDIGHIARGNPVAFTVETYPSREFTGYVERMAPKATIVSRS